MAHPPKVKVLEDWQLVYSADSSPWLTSALSQWHEPVALSPILDSL